MEQGYQVYKRKINVKKLVIVGAAFISAIVLLIMLIRNSANNLHAFPEYSKNVVLEGVEIKSIIEYYPSYIAVHYPVLLSETINKTISEMVEKEIEEFKTKSQGVSSEKAELYMSFETYKFKSRYIGFKFIIYEHLPAQANGLNKVKTMTFDMTNEKLVALEDLFPNKEYLELLSGKSYEYFSAREEFRENLEALKNGLLPSNKENFSKFILTDNSLELVFNPYQIANRTGEVPTYSIPLEELLPYMRSSALEERAPLKHGESEEGYTVSGVVDIPQENIEELRDKKLIAFTFDDGPDKECTNALLDVLKEENVRATFFVLGSRAEYYPETLKRTVAEGHQVGNHTYSHKRLTKLSEEEIQYEINITNQIIKDITGVTVSAIRTPYGENNAVIRANANLPMILWTVDSEDWKTRDAQLIYEAIVSEVKEGDIVILHDIYPTTVEGAKLAIQHLKAEGYTFVTVDTLIKIKIGEPVPNQVYRKMQFDS